MCWDGLGLVEMGWDGLGWVGIGWDVLGWDALGWVFIQLCYCRDGEGLNGMVDNT